VLSTGNAWATKPSTRAVKAAEAFMLTRGFGATGIDHTKYSGSAALDVSMGASMKTALKRGVPVHCRTF